MSKAPIILLSLFVKYKNSHTIWIYRSLTWAVNLLSMGEKAVAIFKLSKKFGAFVTNSSHFYFLTSKQQSVEIQAVEWTQKSFFIQI